MCFAALADAGVWATVDINMEPRNFCCGIVRQSIAHTILAVCSGTDHDDAATKCIGLYLNAKVPPVTLEKVMS